MIISSLVYFPVVVELEDNEFFKRELKAWLFRKAYGE
jgi:hypothetical protein